MSTSTFTFTPDMSVAANVQAFISGIDTFIAGLSGWSNNGDTGQVTPGSATAITSNNDYTRYRVYTDGVFVLKIGFGRENSAQRPALQITVGRTSNGAGTLSNVSHSAQVAGTAQDLGAGVNSATCDMSGGAGRLMLTFGLLNGVQNQNGTFWWHRSVDSSGANLATSVESFTQYATTNAYGILPTTGTIPSLRGASNGNFALCNQFPDTNWAIGAALYYGFGFLALETAVMQPSPAMCWSGSSNVTNNTTITESPYGTSRTYLALTHLQAQGSGSGANARGLVLYD